MAVEDRGHHVGFFGCKVLARTDMPLTSVEAIVSLGGHIDHEAALGNGWRIATVHHGQASDDALLALVAEVGGHVLLAEVYDSDFAAVGFASPTWPMTRFILHPGRIPLEEEVGDEDPVDPEQQASAPAALQDWAGEGADQAELTRVVAGELLFVEDSVLRLAAALGAFPIADLAEYAFGPVDDPAA